MKSAKAVIQFLTQRPISKFIFIGNIQKARKDQLIYSIRRLEHALVVDPEVNECHFLKWKTCDKMQRKASLIGM